MLFALYKQTALYRRRAKLEGILPKFASDARRLRNARAKGKQLGRPKKILDTKRIAELRDKGIGWKRIAAELGVGVGTVYQTSRR